ncbi:MAG TPA: hypothetical protein DEO88_01025 [Syntrophobacteraceae bacterium]|nr:hypothetical protein [Syntrophobacteraceae bacterium]
MVDQGCALLPPFHQALKVHFDDLGIKAFQTGLQLTDLRRIGANERVFVWEGNGRRCLVGVGRGGHDLQIAQAGKTLFEQSNDQLMVNLKLGLEVQQHLYQSTVGGQTDGRHPSHRDSEVVHHRILLQPFDRFGKVGDKHLFLFKIMGCPQPDDDNKPERAAKENEKPQFELVDGLGHVLGFLHK